MTRFNHHFADEQKSRLITIIKDGKSITMTTAEYNAMRNKGKKSKKRKVVETYIKSLPPYIKRMLDDNKTITSLSAYYRNAYRQWGVVGREVIESLEIGGVNPLLGIRIKTKEINATLERIKVEGKHNSKDIFGLIEKMSYQVDDLMNDLKVLQESCSRNGTLDRFEGSNAIEEDGRRKGLRVLMANSFIASYKLKNTINELTNMVIDGVPIFEYCPNTLQRR